MCGDLQCLHTNLLLNSNPALTEGKRLSSEEFKRWELDEREGERERERERER